MARVRINGIITRGSWVRINGVVETPVIASVVIVYTASTTTSLAKSLAKVLPISVASLVTLARTYSKVLAFASTAIATMQKALARPLAFATASVYGLVSIPVKFRAFAYTSVVASALTKSILKPVTFTSSLVYSFISSAHKDLVPAVYEVLSITVASLYSAKASVSSLYSAILRRLGK